MGFFLLMKLTSDVLIALSRVERPNERCDRSTYEPNQPPNEHQKNERENNNTNNVESIENITCNVLLEQERCGKKIISLIAYFLLINDQGKVAIIPKEKIPINMFHREMWTNFNDIYAQTLNVLLNGTDGILPSKRMKKKEKKNKYFMTS